MPKIKKTLVRISALAVLASPFYALSANAQVLDLSCKRPIDIGNLIATGCSAKYIIAPDNAHADTGCLIFNNMAVAGSCTLRVLGPAATKSAVVTFQKAFFNISGSKGGVATMTDLRMKNRTQPTITPTLTIPPTTLNAGTINIDIGGSLNYDNGQAEGTYSGKVAISANFN
ncbi:MAG: DUF4402 domain-containing protein [Pseudomonadota bacterium]